jgi:endonuclease/exonuclease/phosphatase family metal-dependent hydrolase
MLACLAACGDDLLQADGAPVEPVTAMSYNVAQIDGGDRAAQVADLIAATHPDFVALQECVSCDAWLAAELGSGFEVRPSRSGVAIGHESSRWVVSDEGVLSLGDNDDGWGERVAQWGLFSTADGQAIYVYATHWCVTIRQLDDACTVDRQLEYAQSLVDHIQGRAFPGIPVVVAGDLNVFDGFEGGEVISFLTDSGLEDLFRLANPDADGTTFLGNSWAPRGRLDYVFSTAPVDVIDARIDQVDASDHYPVVATVQYPADR